MHKFTLWGLLCGFLAFPAGAATIFTLDVDGCTSGCGTAPFATITLTEFDSSVHVLETLLQGDQFVSTGAGQALEFNISGNPAINISNITSGFSVGPAPASASIFGSFGYSIHCSGCDTGASHPLPGPLEFDVSLPGGTVSIASFIPNAGGHYFASDILGTNGNTGNVADHGDPPVPEPLSFLLVGTGLLALGLLRFRGQAT